MIAKDDESTKGIGNLQFIVILLLLAVACYVGFKMGEPYYAYRSLQSTMKQWAKITLYRGDNNYSDLYDKMKWTIERHNIPLSIEDVEVVFDREEKTLSVYAEYDVYVELPGYEHHYFFQPYAEAHAENN